VAGSGVVITGHHNIAQGEPHLRSGSCTRHSQDRRAAHDARLQAILTEDARFEGPTPPLTGPAALDFDSIAEIASETVGRPFSRTVVPDDVFREQVLTHGAPDPIADLMLSIFAAARHGGFTAVDSTLAELIGHKLAAFRAQLEHAWAA
jgi:uncharacterized protein YbjT (DUF2867 family)